jgi:hypothetical protein
MKRPIDIVFPKIVEIMDNYGFIYRAYAYANVGAIEGYSEIALIHVWFDADSFVNGKPMLRLKLYENGQMEIERLEGYEDLSKKEKGIVEECIEKLKNIKV